MAYLQPKLLLDGGPDVGVRGAGAAAEDDRELVKPIKAALLRPENILQ